MFCKNSQFFYQTDLSSPNKQYPSLLAKTVNKSKLWETYQFKDLKNTFKTVKNIGFFSFHSQLDWFKMKQKAAYQSILQSPWSIHVLLQPVELFSVQKYW